jgi:SAM-dependent methyltransferase
MERLGEAATLSVLSLTMAGRRAGVDPRARVANRGMAMPVEFGTARTANYVIASALAPGARDAELVALGSAIDALPPASFHNIIDLGAGHGFATECLRQFLAPSSCIYSADSSEFMLTHSIPQPDCRVVAGPLDRIPLKDGSIALASSLASFHHVTHKTSVLHEIHRLLADDGYVVIEDVNHDTAPQVFFDKVVRWNCVTGHEFDFLDAELARALARRTRFEHVSSEIVETPWRFESTDAMVGFIHALMSIDMELPRLRDAIDEWLCPIVDEATGAVVLPWQLGIHVLRRES